MHLPPIPKRRRNLLKARRPKPAELIQRLTQTKGVHLVVVLVAALELQELQVQRVHPGQLELVERQPLADLMELQVLQALELEALRELGILEVLVQAVAQAARQQITTCSMTRTDPHSRERAELLLLTMSMMSIILLQNQSQSKKLKKPPRQTQPGATLLRSTSATMKPIPTKPKPIRLSQY